MTTFPAEVVEAVLHHMNDDHTDDSLVIVRAFAETDAVSAVMTGLDSAGGTWDVDSGSSSRTVTIPWTEPALERADLRREVVRLHDQAVEKLGLPARDGH
ncbi:MAG: DUF2470 domain-containing protein [Aeromicrobium sp.]